MLSCFLGVMSRRQLCQLLLVVDGRSASFSLKLWLEVAPCELLHGISRSVLRNRRAAGSMCFLAAFIPTDPDHLNKRNQKLTVLLPCSELDA